MLTARTRPEDLELLGYVGADIVMTKPFGIDELVGSLTSWSIVVPRRSKRASRRTCPAARLM